MENQQQDAVVVMRAATRELFEVVSSSDTTKNIFDEECREEEKFAREAVKRYLKAWSEVQFPVKAASEGETFDSDHGEASFYREAVRAALAEDGHVTSRVVHLGGGTGRSLLACCEASRDVPCRVEAFTGRSRCRINPAPELEP